MMLSKSLRLPSSRLVTSKARKAATSFFSTSSQTQTNGDPRTNVVIVDGVRLPFALSSTIYADEMAVDLQRMAFKGLVDKTAIDRKEIDYVISGTVIQEVKTSNIAREAAVNAGLPISIGAHTVSMVSSSMLCVILCYMFMLYIYVICYDRICCYDLL